MLVTFSCDAHENITMFGDVALKLLTMMGQSGAVPSAILADDVSGALATLTASLAVEKKSAPTITSSDDGEDDEVSLNHRAIPLIELLQAAVKKHCNVMWK